MPSVLTVRSSSQCTQVCSAFTFITNLQQLAEIAGALSLHSDQTYFNSLVQTYVPLPNLASSTSLAHSLQPSCVVFFMWLAFMPLKLFFSFSFTRSVYCHRVLQN
jgi:hypothetical protein